MKLLLMCVVLVLAGCSDRYDQVQPKAMPPELKDCTFTDMVIDDHEWRIVRCPNSTTNTTYVDGKIIGSTAVIEQ